MKKVRFEAVDTAKMNDSECHSPRPFLETRVSIENTALCYDYCKPLTFSMDPVRRFETSNSSPYPLANRTDLDDSANQGYKWSPSSDLELSMLDATCHEPRRPPIVKPTVFQPNIPTLPLNTNKELRFNNNNVPERIQPSVLTSIENTRIASPSSNLNPDNSFFITKGNLRNFQSQSVSNLHRQFKMLSFDKENNPASRKLEMMTIATPEMNSSPDSKRPDMLNASPRIQDTNNCSCHHCILNVEAVYEVQTNKNHCGGIHHKTHVCNCMKPVPSSCNCHECVHNAVHHTEPLSHASPNFCDSKPQNTVDKKTWAIEKYEQSKNTNSTEVRKQTSGKEKREPTVADLFKIIKLQNEQLQLLQERVDKFISASSSRPASMPIQSYTTEHVALETVNSEQHKISIGVMTSFEMVRTSTVINKEVVKQTENSQIQCNRSQISIKEVVSKSQPVNLNFLDGIAPVGQNLHGMQEKNTNSKAQNGNYEEKTLNELSLYNVQVDNATTPLMSPEQTMYLDVRDYSDSDPGSDDQSNVGWTYYNKVMTHVNGMLQDSDMPSSASAMYRNTRQQCLQMQIDKTNVSVTKRVKFGDDPVGIHQPHIYTATTDTSMKMNQLAAKYLKNVPAPPPRPPPPPPPVPDKTGAPFDMSFATRNYMERHKLLQGVPGYAKEPESNGIPRFLDITALKKQPKLL